MEDEEQDNSTQPKNIQESVWKCLLTTTVLIPQNSESDSCNLIIHLFCFYSSSVTLGLLSQSVCMSLSRAISLPPQNHHPMSHELILCCLFLWSLKEKSNSRPLRVKECFNLNGKELETKSWKWPISQNWDFTHRLNCPTAIVVCGQVNPGKAQRSSLVGQQTSSWNFG